MTPNADSRHAATRRIGTCVSRRRAIVDSTTPTTTATTNMPASEHRPVTATDIPVAGGSARRTIKAPKSKQFQRRTVEDHAEGRAAVIEHHHLVDHRQFQVRVRIVERDPAVLRQQDDEPAQQHQGERSRRRSSSARRGARRASPARVNWPESFASTSSPRKNAGSARQANVTSRAAPIPSNGEPVSSAAEAVKNRPRPSRYASRIRSPVNEIGALGVAQRNQEQRRKPPSPGLTTGPARNTQVVVVLKTEPFWNSLIRS